ncbi:MAG: AbrB/MazE/SpoVT family DNA-binding domain-containing protein [Armatimonadota bacterium]
MQEVTISPKFQIVIPKAVRERLQFRVGQKLGVLTKGHTVCLVPLRPVQELKGIAKGATMEGYREEEDRY